MFQILIVEDDKELSQLFQKVLEKNGYQVKSASDGAQALEVLDKEYIDLIISDIMMPVMDGYELVSELRSAGYQIPVLMITAKGSFEMCIRDRDYGVAAMALGKGAYAIHQSGKWYTNCLLYTSVMPDGIKRRSCKLLQTHGLSQETRSYIL